MGVAKASKHCDTCKSFRKYGSYCDDLRHVSEVEPGATYVPTKASAGCQYWIKSPLLKSVEVGSRPGYRVPSSTPEIYNLEPESTNDR